MSANLSRQSAITAVTNYTAPEASFSFADTKPTELFGCNVFNDNVMKDRLPKKVYKSVKKTIEKGAKLDPTVADAVANAMKDWAMEKGATHYTHVFYPLTGLTAEKHDGFLSPKDQVKPLLNLKVNSSFRVSPMHPASLTAACAQHLKHADTQHGTLPAPHTSLKTPTELSCASPQLSSPGTVKLLIKRHLCSEQTRLSTPPHSAS